MKKLLYIVPLLLGMALTSCYDEDIDQLNDRLDKVEGEVDAIQALLDAYNKQLHIIDIEEVSEGYIVTFSDDSTITIRHGKDGENGKDGKDGKDGENGKDGDSHIESIVVGDTTVIFTLSNGEVITLPLSVTFGIVFNTPDVLMCDPGKSTTVAYTITGGDEGTMVEAWGDSGWSAEVIAKSPSEGVVKVTAPSNSRSGKIVVLAISGEGRSVMKTLYFVDGILEGIKNSYYVGWEATSLKVTLTTSLTYSVSISTEARSWVKLDAGTRGAVREDTITFSIAENPEGSAARTAEIELLNEYGNVLERFFIIQKNHPSSEGVIEFEDEWVESICVARFDTSGDGTLSFLEASQVASIPS